MVITLPEQMRDFAPMQGGFSSECFTDSKVVHKLVPIKSANFNQANRFLETLQNEYELNRQYLGDRHVAPTFMKLVCAADYGWYKNHWFIDVEQRFIEGSPLRGSIDMSNPQIREFFEAALNLWERRRMVPDLLPDIMPDPSLGVYFTGRYTYRSGPNVVLSDGVPVLIDTTLNRTLRSDLTGSFARPLVATKVKSLLK